MAVVTKKGRHTCTMATFRLSTMEIGGDADIEIGS
jgi:hypothetical protein